MTRKQFLHTSAATAAAPAVHLPAQTRGRPKNVLFLLSDQHKPLALSLLNHPYARTPNLDALAREGTRFSSVYCTNPVCTPSRASILTGFYTHNHRTWNNTTPWPFEIKTMAHHFARAGYVSALIGKMHFVDAQTHGFEYRIDFNDWFQYLGPKTKLYAEELARANSGSGHPQIDDLWQDFGDPWLDVREKDGRQGSVHIGRPSKLPEQDHQESFVARESIRFLKRFGKQHPFFLISSYLKPHDPFMPAERFARMFPPEAMQLPETYGKVDLERVPAEIRNRIELDRATPELKLAANAKMRIAMYYGNVAQVDDAMGQVLRALKELDLDRDTIVVYSSDHGEMCGEHGLWNKFVFYEPSVGVPLIFKVPGIKPGVVDAPLSQVCLMATLLDLCGIPGPMRLDGGSLVPFLHEPARTSAAPVFSEFALRTKNAKYMIRHGDWKYSFYANDRPELYNLREDRLEMNNLAGEPKTKEIETELKQRLFQWHRPPEAA